VLEAGGSARRVGDPGQSAGEVRECGLEADRVGDVEQPAVGIVGVRGGVVVAVGLRDLVAIGVIGLDRAVPEPALVAVFGRGQPAEIAVRGDVATQAVGAEQRCL